MDFKENIRLSFKKARQDFEAIKQNVTDWIFSINKRQTQLEHKIKVMEDRIKYLENIAYEKTYKG